MVVINKIIVNLTTEYNETDVPFLYIRRYECKYLYEYISSCERNSTIENPEYKKQNNQYTIITKFNDNLEYIFIEIKPKYDIDYMIVETEFIEIYNSRFLFKTNYFILFIIAAIIISLIVICIIFIIMKCKANSMDLPISPLYPNNENEIPQNFAPQLQQRDPYSQNNYPNQQN